MAFILHDSRPAQTFVLSSEEFTNFTSRHLHAIGIEKKWRGTERLHAQISPPAVRWVLICCWHPQQSLPSYPTHLSPSSCQPFISQSVSVTHAPHYPCVFPPQTRELQNCPWALLVPAPLKRLVTQASSGPRVWKLLIEDRLQPE